jgi:hypothetical protein
LTGAPAPGDHTPLRDGGGGGGRGGGGGSGGGSADKAGTTSSTGSIAGDPNIASPLLAVGGAATCLHHRRSTASVKVGKRGGAGTGRQSLRRILQRAGLAGQQAGPKSHGGGVGHNRRGGGTTRVDRIVDNHPGIPPLPKLNRRLPPDGRGGLNSPRTWNFDRGIDPDVSVAGLEDANREPRADRTVHASWHHRVCFAVHGH